jgi:hypothetical protein
MIIETLALLFNLGLGSVEWKKVNPIFFFVITTQYTGMVLISWQASS